MKVCDFFCFAIYTAMHGDLCKMHTLFSAFVLRVETRLDNACNCCVSVFTCM